MCRLHRVMMTTIHGSFGILGMFGVPGGSLGICAGSYAILAITQAALACTAVMSDVLPLGAVLLQVLRPYQTEACRQSCLYYTAGGVQLTYPVLVLIYCSYRTFCRYSALTEIAKPKQGETVFVTGASGQCNT
jgi:hypothetical protein